MKSLWIYVIIGSTAFTVGATGGIVGKRVLGAVETQYIGELQTMDIEELMKSYEDNPNQNFSAAELVNIALEKYRRCEYSYSVSKGTAKTVVNQTIRNYQIRNQNSYFEESISKSSMVALANRMTQEGAGNDVNFYKGKATSEEAGAYGDTPTVMSADEYREYLGRTLDEMFIYVISNKTVLKEGTEVVHDSNGYTIKLVLDPKVSTYNYKRQMLNISGLDGLPVFEYVYQTYTLTDDLMLQHLTVQEKYKAAMGISVDITNYLETDYYPNVEHKIPALDEPLEYLLRGE